MSTRNVYVFTMAGTDLETPAAKARDSRGVAWSMISVCPFRLINLKYYEGGWVVSKPVAEWRLWRDASGQTFPPHARKILFYQGCPKMKNLQLASKMID